MLVQRSSVSGNTRELVVSDLMKALEHSKQADTSAGMETLVFNVSVLYWRVSRNLMQDGKWHRLLPSIETVVDALQTVGCSDVLWAVRLMFVLAKAKHAGGDSKAAETIVKASQTLLEEKTDDPKIREQAARLQLSMDLHVKVLGGKKTYFSSEVLETMIKVRLGESAALTKPEGYVAVLESCHASLLLVKGVTNEEDMKSREWDNEADGRQRHEALRGLVEIARKMLRHASTAGNVLAVSKQGGLVRKSIDLVSMANESGKAAIDAELLALEYELELAKHSKNSEYSRSAVKQRVELVGQTLTTLQRARNAADGALVQRACCNIWNAARPLLQPNLRAQVKRPLLKIVEALSSIQSTMLGLQCCAHLELAKIADDDGLLTTVAAYLARAQQLDERSEYTAELNELNAQLATKQAVEQLADNRPENISTPQEKALALIAESGSASSAALRRKPLLKAGLMFEMDLFHEEQFPALIDAAASQQARLKNIESEIATIAARPVPSGGGGGGGGESRKGDGAASAATSRAEDGRAELAIWSQMARAARKSGDWDVAYAAAKLALLRSKMIASIEAAAELAKAKEDAGGGGGGGSSNGVNKVLREQAELNFIVGETSVQLLRTEGFKLTPQAPDAASASVEGGAGTEKTWAEQMTQIVFDSFNSAAHISVDVGEPWITINAGVYLWNYCADLIQAQDAGILAPFKEMRIVIANMAEEHPEETRLRIWPARYTNVLGRVLTQQAQAAASDTEVTGPDPATLEEALTACNDALVALGSRSYEDSSELCITRVQLLEVLSKPMEPPADADAHIKAFTVLEACKHEADCGPEVYNAVVEAVFQSADALTISRSSKASGSPPPLSPGLTLALLTNAALACARAKQWAITSKCADRAIIVGKRAMKRWPKSLPDRRVLLFTNECALGLANVAAIDQAPDAARGIISRQLALKKFVNALLHAVDLKALSLVEAASRYIWNTALPLTRDPTTKSSVTAPIRAALWQLSAVEGKKTENKLMVREKLCMYTLLFECYAEEENWSEGLRTFEHAIASIPRPSAKPLWTYRLIFRSKLGENMSRDMSRFQQEPPEVHAEAWRSLAKVKLVQTDRLEALHKAVSILQGESGLEFRCAEVLTDIASWHMRNPAASETSVQEVEDVLETAVDTVMNAKTAGEENAHRVLPQQELLARLHGMLAEIQGGFGDRVRHAMLAYEAYVKMWSITINRANAAMALVEPEEPAVPEKAKKKGSKTDCAVPEAKPGLVAPQSLDDWSKFELPGTVVEQLAAERDEGEQQFESVVTFARPELVSHHAMAVAKVLESLGFDHLSLPVLHVAMAQYYPQGATPNIRAFSLVATQLARCCKRLGLADASDRYVSLSAVELPTAKETSDTAAITVAAQSLHVLRPITNHHMLVAQAKGHLAEQDFVRAHSLLYHARIVAVAAQDSRCLAEINVYEGILGHIRDNAKDAVAALTEAFAAEAGSSDFWVDAVLAISDVLAAQVRSALTTRPKTAGAVLLRLEQSAQAAIAAMDRLASSRPHASAKYTVAAAKLKVKFAEVVAEFSADLPTTVDVHGVFAEAVAAFATGGEILAGIDAQKRQASVWLASRGHDAESQSYRDAMTNARQLLGQAERQAVELHAHVEAVGVPVPAVMPTSELIVDLRLMRCSLEAELFKWACVEAHAALVRKSRPETIEEKIANFVADEESEEAAEKRKWDEKLATSGEMAIGRLSSTIAALADEDPRKAVANALHGRVLRLSAEKERQEIEGGHSAGVWSNAAFAAATKPLAAEDADKERDGVRATPAPAAGADGSDAAAAAAAANSTAPGGGAADDAAERAAAAGKAEAGGTAGGEAEGASPAPPRAPPSKAKFALAESMLRQAVASLSSSVPAALDSSQYALSEGAALDMVEALGLADHKTAAKFLALYQACRARTYLEGVFRRTCAPAFASTELSLLKVLDLPCSPERAAECRHQLEARSVPFGRMKITSKFLNDVSTLAPEFRSLVLQHSANGKYLYGAIISSAGFYCAGDEEDTRQTVARAAVDPADLAKIQAAYTEYQVAVAVQLRLDGDDAGKVAEHGAADADADAAVDVAAEVEAAAAAAAAEVEALALANVDGDENNEAALGELKDTVVADIETLAAEAAAAANPAPIFETGTKVDSMLADVVEMIEAYLAPVLGQLTPVLLSVDAAIEEKVGLVLVADAALLNLPLEGLALARAPEVNSVTRDFSLAVFCSRLAGTSDAEEGAPPPKSGKKSAGKKGKVAPIEPVPAVLAQFAYAVDVQADTSGEAEVMEQLKSGFEAGTKAWLPKAKGVSGIGMSSSETEPAVSDQLPSHSELVNAFRESSGFFHYGPGTLLDCLYPNELSGLPLANVRMAVLLDRASSYAIQLKQDRRSHLKFKANDAINTSVHLAALLTLSGVSSVMLNTYDTSVAANEDRLGRISGVLQQVEGGGVGVALRKKLLGPKQTAEELELEAVAAAGGKAAKPKSAKKPKKGEEPEPEPPQLPKVFEPAGKRLCTVLYGLPHVVMV